MNSDSDKTIGANNSVRPHSQSFNIQYLFIDQHKLKRKNPKSILKNNRLYEYQRKKGDFKYLQKYVHKHFINFYKNSKNDYNIRMIDDILNNESAHLVAEFKDYLIMGDITEFLQKSYNINECKKYLPKIYEYYNSCSVIFPNYVKLHESKYIYKNIRKKQKVIDNQQEQEDKQEKIKKGSLKIENNDIFFTTKTFNSILDQTNTSNLKLFFGIKDNNDINETPNNIMEKLEEAENEVMKRKMNLVKNKNYRQKSNIIEINNVTSTIKTNSNSNIFNNNSKIFNENKSISERNKSNNNVQYSRGVKKKNNMKLNNINSNFEKSNKMNGNNYIKNKSNIINNEIIKKKKEKGQKNSIIKSNSNITENDNENIRKNNFTNLYGNKIINTKRPEIRKFLIDNNNISRNKKFKIYFRSNNHSNKNIKRQFLNSLFPSNSFLSKIFKNKSILKNNSFNYINKKSKNKNNTNVNANLNHVNDVDLPLSPSSITIHPNPFKNNNYNLKINIKESNSSRNMTNNKLNENPKPKEKFNLKNIQEKLKRNKGKTNHIIDYNNNTIATSTSKTTSNKEKIKYIHKNKNFVYNKVQMINNYSNYKNYKTIENNNSPKNEEINEPKRNINNINNTNNYMIKNVNINKINSSSNIQKPMKMNININMNNMNNKNKVYFQNGSNTNIIQNKEKLPLSIEIETIKVSKKKRILYPKSKPFSDVSNNSLNYKNIHNKNIYTNYNTINSNPNINSYTLSNDKNNNLDSLNYTSLNSNNLNEEAINNGLTQNYSNNFIHGKKNIFLDELYKKKNIILPYNKEINNINININGYNRMVIPLTSKACNNGSYNKYKKNNNKQEKILYNSEDKFNKNKPARKSNNLVYRNEGNAVKIKTIYKNIKNNKQIMNNKNSEFFSSKKK